jgi:hypothetical protein
MEIITLERLGRVVELYKNGVQNWHRDTDFLIDCAYYEGVIKRACDYLQIPIPYTHIDITEGMDPGLEKMYQKGYDTFWAKNEKQL